MNELEECNKCGYNIAYEEGEYIGNSFYCNDCIEASDSEQDEKDNSSCYSSTY